MKKVLLLLVLALAFVSSQASAQWNCVMATEDASGNGTGYQVPSVAVIQHDLFMALAVRVQIPNLIPYDDVNNIDSVSADYYVGYKDATNSTGRQTLIPYAEPGYFMKWTSGFDEVQLWRSYKTIGKPDSMIYVTNNDPDHNILVFQMGPDSVIPSPYRLTTGTDDIMGLGVDDSNYIYVLSIYAHQVRIYEGPKRQPDAWSNAPNTETPVQTIDLPVGIYRGLAVSPNGKLLFVSSITDRNVVKYIGTPASGYTKDTGFSFALTDGDSIPETSYYDTASSSTKWDMAKPLGMAFLPGNNLLYVACARWLGNNILTHTGISGYTYSRVYTVNPNTGAPMDTLDVAKWYFDRTGSYSTQDFAQNVSGYSSTYDVAFDENKAMYLQSFYSWTVEKWEYTGTLPNVVLGVKDQVSDIPTDFSLAQNYPNPFNPSTTIRYSVEKTSHVRLSVYNVLGQLVKTLVDESVSAGTHQVTFDASRLSSGVYIYTMQAGNFSESKRMTLVK